MKKYKKGFSLAEVLIAIAIISVIATLGFTAAKKSIENSYNLYIYTAYKGLVDIITDAGVNGLSLGADLDSLASQRCFEHMAEALNGEYTRVIGRHTITAPNEVSYEFVEMGFPAAATFRFHRINMTVPYKKFTNNNGDIFNQLLFRLDYYYQPVEFTAIIPFGVEVRGSGIDLINRRDILPFYIDDGQVGRIINGFYRQKTYYSYREAHCRTLFQGVEFNNGDKFPNQAWNCDGIAQADRNSVVGSIRVENPKKAFRL